MTIALSKNHHSTSRGHSRSWWAAPVAVLATVLGLPVNAGVAIPDDPLTTTTRVAPNILFILDDSGSMNFVAMPESAVDAADLPNSYGVSTTLSDNPRWRSYLNNTVYYNPGVAYSSWRQANGERMTGGMSVDSVYQSWNLASGSTRDLRDNVESVFYVPKPGVTSSTAATDFVRYWVMRSGSGAQVVRARSPAVTVGSWSWDNFNVDEASWWRQQVVVPANTSRLTISLANGRDGANGGDADLYVRFNSAPTTGSYDGRDVGSSNNGTVTLTNPQAGTWHIGVYNASSGSGDRRVYENDVSVEARNDYEAATPTGRSQEDELTNIATWYSYSRSRMKAAKAGASEAFASLDGRVRVGFRTIWGRNGFNIPVGDGNEGRFVDSTGRVVTTSRSTWYSRLHAATGSGGTPLLTALDSAGKYFSDTSTAGPYGPQSPQYSCRQNFSILTTDGYWNADSLSVANEDGTAGSAISGPNDRTFTYQPSAPYRDGFQNTLADVAMKYWKTDLRTDLTNNVPSSTANPAFWQHMVTFGISIGLSGRKGWTSVGQVPAGATWNDPTDAEDADRIDDLLHAAVNGRGAFVAASNPSQFSEGLANALAAIAQRTSSYSNVATNSVSLDTGAQVFSASYVSGIWTGSVQARAVGRTGVSDTIAWSATTPAWGVRKIFTSSASSVGVPGSSGTDFPSNSQEAALARGGGRANFEVTGLENARYLMGKPNNEARNGGTLRNRTSIIGDIVGSSPAYVKDTNTLYVGANDGMLHAFNAETGVELFSYVPNILNFSALSTLSRADYSHKFFVDGPVVVSNRRLTPDRNILVATLGKGGKGLFALDVTDPNATNLAAGDVFEWERAETPGNNMGLVLGKPFFAQVSGGNKAVVFGNGINSTSEKAVLIVLNAETGAVIGQVDTGVGSTAEPNGLSAATGVLGPDGKTLAYVYAGDMRGNVWKFDLTAASAASWSARRIFTAGTASNVQPITGGVTVATQPRTGKRWVFFGTGRYLTTEDADSSSAASTATQTMYGFMENVDGTRVQRTELTQRSLTNANTTMNGFAVRTFDAKAPLPTGSKGWYINLPESGERIVQDAQVVSTFLITASMVPTGSACEADGSGYINALDAFTGTSAGGSYFDLDGDGRTDDSVVGERPVGSINPNVGMPTLPNLLRGMLVVGGTTGGMNDPFTLRPEWERVSWREIRRD